MKPWPYSRHKGVRFSTLCKNIKESALIVDTTLMTINVSLGFNEIHGNYVVEGEAMNKIFGDNPVKTQKCEFVCPVYRWRSLNMIPYQVEHPYIGNVGVPTPQKHPLPTSHKHNFHSYQ